MSESSNFPFPPESGKDSVPPEFEINERDLTDGIAEREHDGTRGVRSPLAEAAAEAARALTKEPRAERRKKRRAMISAPVRVRGVDVTSGAPVETSTTVDVSRIGFLFITSNCHYQRGMEVLVTFPYSPAAGDMQAEQPGRVVRVHDMGDGRRGVAIATGTARQELVDAGGRRLGKEAPAQGPLRELSAADGEKKKELVVVVDADALIRNALKTYLSNEGYEVIAVETAGDARDVLNMFTPSIVIAEIEGEGLPGYDLCAHVKCTPRLQHIPVVLMTSSAYPSDYSSAHSLGAVVCMAKPFKQERLGHIVRLLVPTARAREMTSPPRAGDPTRRAGGKRPRSAKPANGNGSRGFRIFP
jgi:CheY-like chemotaxis protein